jgi:S-adenosylmethionine:tRNA ribosyltransferase-isomerase
LKKSDFHYDLPEELIAQAPLPQRSASRLLVVDAAKKTFADRAFTDLADYLRAGDLLVFNDTRVIPARLFGRKETGGAVEILIERVTGEFDVLAQLGVSKKPKTGSAIILDDQSHAQVLGREGEFYSLRFAGDQPLDTRLTKLGRTPLPPYIHRDAGSEDDTRYQTVYARVPGAVAAPTAGLHFDDDLLSRLRGIGIEFGYVTLHVGAATFQPVRADAIEHHVMHREWLDVSDELVETIRHTREKGGRIVAVGTTVVRALESALRNGELQPFSGDTQIFIYPGYRITSIDALVTNFHLPESTLLMLVSALAGRDLMLDAYRHAVAERYRFFSYGDAMLILPA